MWKPKTTSDPGVTAFVADGKVKIKIDGEREAEIPFADLRLGKLGSIKGEKQHIAYLQAQLREARATNDALVAALVELGSERYAGAVVLLPHEVEAARTINRGKWPSEYPEDMKALGGKLSRLGMPGRDTEGDLWRARQQVERARMLRPELWEPPAPGTNPLPKMKAVMDSFNPEVDDETEDEADPE